MRNINIHYETEPMTSSILTARLNQWHHWYSLWCYHWYPLQDCPVLQWISSMLSSCDVITDVIIDIPCKTGPMISSIFATKLDRCYHRYSLRDWTNVIIDTHCKTGPKTSLIFTVRPYQWHLHSTFYIHYVLKKHYKTLNPFAVTQHEVNIYQVQEQNEVIM